MLSGKGMYIWQILQCEGGNFELIAQRAAEAGLSHVLIKVADRTSPSNVDARGQDLTRPLASALRAAGVEVWAWQYVYGDDPAGEAQVGAERALAIHAAGFVVDAEVEYKRAGRDKAAIAYMTALRTRLSDVPVALSSYRFPSLHREFPFSAFLNSCDFSMPQVYWMGAHDPAAQLARSVSEYKMLKPTRPIFPTGAAFQEGGWAARPGEAVDFLDAARKLGLPGANFWSYDNCRKYLPAVWQAISAVQWETSKLPPPTAGLRFQVVQEGLKVRTGPGREFLEIGALHAGDLVDPLDIGGASAWAEIRRGEWANIQDGDDRNMEREP